MLKKVNQIRRNFSKGSADKKKEGDSSAKKKEEDSATKKTKSNQKKVNQETQTEAGEKNVSKKLNFGGLMNRGGHLNFFR